MIERRSEFSNRSSMKSFAHRVNANEFVSGPSSRILNRSHSRYNFAMPQRFTLTALLVYWMLVSACTFYGDHPARAFSEATGGEGLEHVFWKDVKTANWVQVERSLASNYQGVTSAGTLRPLGRDGAVSHLAVARLCPRRFADRVERNNRRRDLHHHSAWRF